jgi:GNAT superfamily N-acetyltransferase
MLHIVIMLLLSGFLYSSQNPNLLIRFLKGSEILPYQEEIAKLNIEVFKEYPYFYDGNLQEQIEFHKIYVNSPEGVAFLAEIDGHCVGVALGIPMTHFLPDYQKALTSKGIFLEGIFYLGEFIIRKDYRHQKIGYQLYEKLKAYAKTKYKNLLYSEVVPTSDPPVGYRSIQTLFKDFSLLPNVSCEFSWKELGTNQLIPHTMVFWMQDL